jgi:hypothetical protein
MEFVINTEKGYLKGDLLQGIEFVSDKKDARKFTQTEIQLYGQSIAQDLGEFFQVYYLEAELFELL